MFHQKAPAVAAPIRLIAAILLLAASLPAAQAAPSAAPATTDRPAWRKIHGVLLAIARAGNRLVAVGDRGTVLLSDDQGVSWRPIDSGTDVLLTATIFTSGDEGWAVGQDSTILHTADAGVHWTSQLSAPGKDQALFSIASLGPNHLVASGAYALMLETTNASTWTPVKLPNLDEDYHLNCVMPHGADVVVTGEAGHAFVRHGVTWTPMPVGYEGSQFGCLTTKNGDMYSFGLRGSLFIATATAPAWHRIDTGEQRSIFGGTVLADGNLAMVGSNGLVLLYDPQSKAVHTLPPPTGVSLSGVAEAGGGKLVAVGEDGVHLVDPASAAPEPATAHAAEVTQ